MATGGRLSIYRLYEAMRGIIMMSLDVVFLEEKTWTIKLNHVFRFLSSL